MFNLIKKGGAKRFQDARQRNIKQETKDQCRAIFALSVLFGLGWGFSILASPAISSDKRARFIFSILFTVFIGFQGFLIFLLYIVMSPNAREEWNCWARQKKDKVKVQQILSAGSSSRSIASIGVNKYSTNLMYNKKRDNRGKLYHNVYPTNINTCKEFVNGVFDSKQSMPNEMNGELDDQILPSPLQDYEDTSSLSSETSYIAFPNPEPPLSLEEGVSEPLKYDVECTTLDDPLQSCTGKQISVDGKNIKLLSINTSPGNHEVSFDSFSPSLGFYNANFANDHN